MFLDAQSTQPTKYIIGSNRPDRYEVAALTYTRVLAQSNDRCATSALRRFVPHDNHTPQGVRVSVADSDASLACSFSSHSRSAASERCSSTALACVDSNSPHVSLLLAAATATGHRQH